MKILFVHNKYLQSAGGEDATVESEIKLLRERGHQVEVIYFSNDSFGGSTIDKIKAGFHTIYNPRSRQLIKKAIQSFDPDIIHVHNIFFEASPSVFYAAFELEKPIVMTLHNYRLVCVNALFLRNNKICEDCIHSPFAWRGIVRKCYHDSIRDSAMVALISASHKLKHTWTQKITRYITPSAFMRNKLLESSLQLDPAKISIKQHFIDDPGMGVYENRENYYLFIGRLSAEKGVKFLLESIAGTTERLLVVGDGPEKEMLLEAHKGSRNIEFLGKKDKAEVLRLLKRCKGLLFPSICYEGLPITIIEAFATGTPVIGSDLGGMQEMIHPGVNGMLFEKENSRALKDAIERLNQMKESNDRSLYEGARKTYLRTYHPDVCYEAILNIYKTAITEKNKTSNQ